MLVRVVECLEGHVEVELVCTPVFDYGQTPATWELVGDDRCTRPDASGGRAAAVRLRTDLPSASRATRYGPGGCCTPGDTAYCALSWGDDLGRAGRPSTTACAPDEHHRRVLALWLANARIPDHRWG